MSNEVQLLENVELKLAMCNTDAQLEKTIQIFLPPVLLKLASTNAEAKKKVMEILSHINKRVKTNDKIKLPFDALLSQFTDPSVSTFVKNFTLMYLEMAASRLSAEETAHHVPEFLRGISNRPVQQRIPLLHIVLPVLIKWKMDHGEQLTARTALFHFDENPNDISVILSFFLDVMLYQPLTAREIAEQEEESTAPKYPGLSPLAVEEVTNKGKMQWTTSKLKDAKLGIMNLILTPIFTDSERLPLLVAGVCDPNHQVVSACEDGMRRWTGNVDYEDEATIKSLYKLYLGSKPTAKAANKDGRSQAPNAVKLRILQYLSKSIAATNMVAPMIQVIFDGIYGDLTTAKLQRSAMSFLQWCARMSKESSIGPVAPVIISGLLKYINENEETQGYDAESIKGYAYIACGLVAKKAPMVGLQDTGMLSLFFDNLEQEQKNVRTYVQDALSSMMEIYVDIAPDAPIYHDLQQIILKAVQKSDSYSRYMALKYANAIYPFSNVFARYVCLLGSSNSVVKLDVKEEARRGLVPFVRNKYGLVENVDVIAPTELPQLNELVNYIHSHRPDENYSLLSKTPVVKGYPVEVYAEMLRFLRMIWILQVNPTNILIDQYVADKVENSMSEDPVTMSNFKNSVTEMWSHSEDKQVLQYWLEFVEQGLDPELKDSILLATSAKCLLEIISLGPSSISTTFKDRLSFFKLLSLSDKLDARILVSHIFGIIASNDSVPQAEIDAMLSEFCDILEAPEGKQQQAMDHRHGATLSIGYLVGRCHYRKRSLPQTLYQRCVSNLVNLLEGPASSPFYMMASAACQAIAEIGRSQLLPFPVEKSADNSMDIGLALEDIIEKLAKLANTCKEAKVQEKATVALGHLSIPLVQHSHSALVQKTVDALYMTADTKQVELAFASGEAWSVLAFGWDSQSMQKYKDMSDMPLLQDLDTKESYAFQPVIDKMIRTYVTSNRSWYRKAACIWLLSILKFGRDQPLVKTNLGNMHASFSRLLADRDDFTQECASKGLGLVYEYGDAKIKEDMLYALVGTFTEGRQIQAQSVTDNTVLFEEGALGETPDGNSITTYKELCSLASELNQPDLIYKFMNLANHNAMWTSRRGAAFGFQNLMALAEKEMEPYLPRLIPKLYRYQFDPNPRVNQTMKSIWKSLVKDNQKTVDTYFNEIMEDLLTGLGNRQWRIREASCAAITDLVMGRQLAQIEPYLEQLWQMCFRALDDIKDSVRQAATATCRSLTKLTVHYCDPTMVAMADGLKVMDIVMPFLLQKGIVSDAEDVRKFSLDAVLRVCKTGAALLKKYVPELIDTLLQSLSSLEPQSMNYLSFHVDKYNISQEQLDNARLSGAKNSPMMEGIEHCVNQIDEQVMEELTPRILHIVRKGTGLPTKAGCARFIVTLVMNRRSAFKPFADAYLKALSGTIRSKNSVIRKSYATAIGYVCQLATYDRLISVVKHLKKLYIDEEDEDAKAGSAVTAAEITRFATDRANSIATVIVPLIFFGEHDPEEDMNKLWKAAWENLTSGTRSMVTMYADEILEFVQPLLTSSSWKIKQTAALTIADMCKVSGKGVQVHAHKLLPVLVSTLATRSWAGKENVLDAFVQLCISAKDSFGSSETEPSLAEVAKIMVREAKRKNRAYQRHALVSLASFNDCFAEKIDVLDMEQEFLTELCEMDETAAMEDEDNDNAKPLLLMIKANAFKAIVSAYRPQSFSHQESQTSSLAEMITNCLRGNVWNVQLAILQSLKTFVEHATSTGLADDKVMGALMKAAFDSLDDLKYSAIRSAAVDVLEQLVSSGSVQGNPKTVFTQGVVKCVQQEPIALIKDRLQKLSSRL
ncbi:proteasome-associated protein ECM29 homolog [Mucor ambiguus]|uniref:Proteasome-associated protein ECM29 homolog n=1 Tax=Mucor ambiguus TaxID=91626 RepID=A0A0C9MJ01_9FUNG|nr:proteasome-associated protein ECM29 homolog [Mucor ambiguus]